MIQSGLCFSTCFCKPLNVGNNNLLVLEPGTSKISVRTSKYFHPMSDGKVKRYSIWLYLIECPALFYKRTSTNLGVLVRRTSEYLKIFFTPDDVYQKPTLICQPLV